MAGTPYFCVHMRLEIQLSRQKTHTTMDVRKEKEFLLPLPKKMIRDFYRLRLIKIDLTKVRIYTILLNGGVKWK